MARPGSTKHPQPPPNYKYSPNILDPPICSFIKGLMVSIGWYLGLLKGQLGGAGYRLSSIRVFVIRGLGVG